MATKPNPKTSELALYQERYPALSNEVAFILKDSLAPGETIGVQNLPTIKVPAGGGLVWTLPDGEPAKELRGVIILHQPVRAYWREAFTGGGEPPDCSSDDARIGYGVFGLGSDANPHGECTQQACPMARFGSGKDNAQACRLVTRVFVLLQGDAIPTLIPVPPTGHDLVKDYAAVIANKGLYRLTAVETVFSLTKDTSRSGIEYSKIQLKMGEPLPAEVAAAMAAYRREMEPLFRAVQVSAEETGVF